MLTASYVRQERMKVSLLIGLPFRDINIKLEPTMTTTQSAYLYKHIQPFAPSTIEAASGIWLTLQNGQKILDATSGAAVSAIGHGNKDVTTAIVTQLDHIAYCHPGFYQTDIAQDLSTFLVNSTGGKMQKALLTGSGTFSIHRV